MVHCMSLVSVLDSFEWFTGFHWLAGYFIGLILVLTLSWKPLFRTVDAQDGKKEDAYVLLTDFQSNRRLDILLF